MFEEKSSRWPIFTMEQPGVVAGNLALSFSPNFLSIFEHILGSSNPITMNLASLEISSSPAEVKYG